MVVLALVVQEQEVYHQECRCHLEWANQVQVLAELEELAELEVSQDLAPSP